MKEFLAQHRKLEIRYFSSYSPDLNPVERVWWYMRKSITLIKTICVINF
ncbi:MAG: transposase [Prevotellaceae bacterium]|nr:transposase [Prevotellaceae bacterium]